MTGPSLFNTIYIIFTILSNNYYKTNPKSIMKWVCLSVLQCVIAIKPYQVTTAAYFLFQKNGRN